MKKVGSIFFLLFISVMSYGQKLEYAVQLNSGLFYYGGKSATRTSDLIYHDVNQSPNFTLNPYGEKSGFSYGLALQMQTLIKNNITLGMHLGYDISKSSVQITRAYPSYSSFLAPNASGKTTLKNQYLTVHPTIGKSIPLNKFTLNLTVGPEASLCLKSTEKGKVTTVQGSQYTTNTELNQPPIDLRARFNVQLSYKRMGIMAGYSYGFTNYYALMAGTASESEIYTRFLRLGISYQIGHS